MMVGCVVGLDDVWQASTMAHSIEHYGQISMVAELAASGDWEPLLLPPVPRLPRNSSHTVRRAVTHLTQAVSAAAAAVHTRRRGKNSGGLEGGAGGNAGGGLGDGSAAPTTAPSGEGRGVSPTSLTELVHRELFPENVKQAIMVKARSRFAQPGESEGDALRVTLVERGGRDVATVWVGLPRALSPAATARPSSGPPAVYGAGTGRIEARETEAAAAGEEHVEQEDMQDK